MPGKFPARHPDLFSLTLLCVGYWDLLVDSEGVESIDTKRLEERFHSSDGIEWRDKFKDLRFNSEGDKNFKQSLTQSMYWGSINQCSIDGEQFGEGLGAYIDGDINANFHYTFGLYVSPHNARSPRLSYRLNNS